MPTLKLFPLSVETYTTAGATFLNPDNIKADDGLYCEITSTAALSSDNIGGTYDFTQIPENAIVTGVTVEAKVYASKAAQSGGLWLNNQWDYLAGTWWVNLPTTPTVLIHDDMPVHNWTREMLVTDGEWNITAFIHEKDDNTTQRKVYVDYIAVNVTYDLPSANDDRSLESLAITENLSFNATTSRAASGNVLEQITSDLDIYNAVKNSIRVMTISDGDNTSFQVLSNRYNDVIFSEHIQNVTISSKLGGSGVNIYLQLADEISGNKSMSSDVNMSGAVVKQLTVIPNKYANITDSISESLNVYYDASSRVITISLKDSEFISANKSTNATITDTIKSNVILSTIQSKVKNVLESLVAVIGINKSSSKYTVLNDSLYSGLLVDYNSILSVTISDTLYTSIDLGFMPGKPADVVLSENVNHEISHSISKNTNITDYIEQSHDINCISAKYNGISIPLNAEIVLDELKGVKFKLNTSIDLEHRKDILNRLELDYRGKIVTTYKKSVYKNTFENLKVEKAVSGLKKASGTMSDTLNVQFRVYKEMFYKMPTLNFKVTLKEYRVTAVKQNKKVKGIKENIKIKGVL